MSDRARNSSLLLFFVLAYGFTWSLHLAIPILDIPFSLELTSPALGLYMLGLLGPLVAALCVAARVDGRVGVRRLLASGVQWRFGITWYACAVLTVPTLMFVNLALVFPDLPKDFDWLRFELLFVVGQIWVVVGEEYGWRGFALPRLQVRFGSLGASLIIGFLWASWHLPMFFTPGSPQYTPTFLSAFVNYVTIVICWSIIMTLLYNRTGGSVLACMLFHAMINIAAFTIYVPAEFDLMRWLYVPVILVVIVLLPRPLFRRLSKS